MPFNQIFFSQSTGQVRVLRGPSHPAHPHGQAGKEPEASESAEQLPGQGEAEGGAAAGGPRRRQRHGPGLERDAGGGGDLHEPLAQEQQFPQEQQPLLWA